MLHFMEKQKTHTFVLWTLGSQFKKETCMSVHKDLFCHIKSSRLTSTTYRYSAEVLAEMMLCMLKNESCLATEWR